MKMFLGLVYLFLLSGSVLCNENCTYPWIIEHMGLTSDAKKNLLNLSRPVKNASQPLEVYLDFKLDAIWDLNEKDQTLITFISIELSWYNEYIVWEDQENCDIGRITVPVELLWKPDIGIYEELEKDTSFSSPFLVIEKGEPPSVHMKKEQKIESRCKMDVHKFPFDTQRCSLSFKSFIHTSEEIDLLNIGSEEIVTEKIFDSGIPDFEWIFQKVEPDDGTAVALDKDQKMIVYTITMKRRSVLYMVNFILPVLFFLALDYASFLMTDRGGDKLAFKITILLAVTVLQLLLNEILPSTSDNIPMIAVFCIGVFCLMKLSLLETIVVMHLRQRDSRCLNHCTIKTAQEDGLKCTSWLKCYQKNSSDDLLSEHTKTKDNEENEGSGPGGSDVERLLQELRHMCTVLSEAVGDSEEEVGYWGSRIYIINRVFLIFHMTCTALFLAVIFHYWID